MAEKVRKTPKKPKATKTPTSSEGDLGRAVHGFAKEITAAIESLMETLRPLQVGLSEEIGDSLGTLASALDGLGKATAMSVIAQYGSPEDRAETVAFLKSWFESGTFSN